MLQCNIVSHWLGPHKKWCLCVHKQRVETNIMLSPFNPWQAEFILRNKKIYLHFLSCLNTELRQVVGIFPYGRQNSLTLHAGTQYIHISHKSHSVSDICYKMVHRGIWECCIVGFEQQVYGEATSCMVASWADGSGDVRNQGISSHGIDPILPEDSNFSTRGPNTQQP